MEAQQYTLLKNHYAHCVICFDVDAFVDSLFYLVWSDQLFYDDGGNWRIGSSDTISNNDPHHRYASSGYVFSRLCPESPEGAGCRGQWLEWVVFDPADPTMSMIHRPGLAVVAVQTS
jgi:hypothetical protein